MRCAQCKGAMHLLRTRPLPELEGKWHVRVFRCVACGTIMGPLLQTHLVLESRESLPQKFVSKEQTVTSSASGGLDRRRGETYEP